MTHADPDDSRAGFCVIGGVAANAYVEPIVTLDLAVEATMSRAFDVPRFSHSLNLTSPESDRRVQIQTDTRYAHFVARA